jgi:putative endonuclease
MDNFYSYILYSKKLDRFYIGSTSLEADKRLERHLNRYYGHTKFTAKADDWVLFFDIKCNSFSQAQKIEKHIKHMKSKTYIQNLKKYPEISVKLLEKYKDKK